MALTQEGPEIFQYLVLALELLDLLLELRDLVVLVDLRRAVSGERVVSHLLVFAGPSSQRRPFMPSSSDRSLTVISPDRAAFSVETLNCLSYRFLLWVILNTFRS